MKLAEKRPRRGIWRTPTALDGHPDFWL